MGPSARAKVARFHCPKMWTLRCSNEMVDATRVTVPYGYLWGLPPVQRLPGSIAQKCGLYSIGSKIVRTQPRDETRGSLRSRTEATRARRGILEASPYDTLRYGYAHPSVEAKPIRLSGIPKPCVRMGHLHLFRSCLLYTSPSPRDLSTSRMPSSA